MLSAVQPTGLRGRDLLTQAVSSLTARPARTAMTMLGTVLGVGAFVAVLGLTSTATGQISGTFSLLKSTQVTVDDVGPADIDGTRSSFPPAAETIAESLNGVSAAGLTWVLPGGPSEVSTSLDPRAETQQLTVSAASPGYLRALEPHVSSGTLLNAFQKDHKVRVAVLGRDAAARLGLRSTVLNPVVFVRGAAYTVVGIIDDVKRQPEALATVFIPDSTAKFAYGNPSDQDSASMLVSTQPGAADQVARQLPVALRPDQPERLRANPPRTDTAVEGNVFASLNPLFLALASLMLLIGAVGIANSSLVAVVERTGEIGLRRALGARPRDIHFQFLTEAVLIGTLGGLIGTALAVLGTLGVSLALQWTAILDPTVTLLAPLIGTIAGALAGLHPAIRAAKISPMAALRR